MRRTFWLGFLAGLLAVALPACTQDVIYVPGKPPIVEPPPVTPPVTPPPVVPPPPSVPPPADLDATLDRIVVGAPLAEVIAALGPPAVAPAVDGGLPTARWFVAVGADRWMVYAVFTDGKVVAKGAVRVEVVR